ncbi:hypothetical protein Ddc_16510 [Ditylenchus destructor]|nr:hypothetical protein Ddc_16510 [Ditylenchus destructor]
MECCENLLESNSNQVTCKRNTWNLLSLDIQLDVFQCLRAYDLHKNGINVSRQWRNTIEQHKRTLPKFRQLTDCRAQNKLIGSNDELRQRQYQMAVQVEKARERENFTRRIFMTIYLVLSIMNFFAILVVQPISAERIVAEMLLLTVTLHMADTYWKVLDDMYEPNQLAICSPSNCGRLPLKYLWIVYLGARFLIFAGFGILTQLIELQDSVFYTILTIFYLPECVYLANWSINVCRPSFCFFYEYRRTVEKLRPDLPPDTYDWYGGNFNWSNRQVSLDVFRFLRAYDLHKRKINVSRQWRNTIEQYKGTLPKFRQLTDCRAQNKLVGDNYEEKSRHREEVSRRNAEAEMKADENSHRIYRNYIKTYILLCILNFIAAFAAQPMIIERNSAVLLLLAVSLQMGNLFEKFLYNPWKITYCYGRLIYGGRDDVRIFNHCHSS